MIHRLDQLAEKPPKQMGWMKITDPSVALVARFSPPTIGRLAET
jgi:hypothetical protein